ncbi:hypothetical protein AXE80_08110 [Wenyingzhuangia fucanilytica]|uniref:CBM-cenC domain-containing protein n=1 Tax=Wenyingzhuangia fucanilytica TaxID=1790137 RepID=A0A1B1Y681_9FLAO|nr:SwmB domain-containing protein [Wenyingzhuangia fucanilytica]ANW96244.1 hypothetical protein AXE80_08110 [Wenyingzhuangia fucanilytica]
MKTYIKIIQVFLFLSVLVSCSDDELTALSDLTDATWTVSEGNNQTTNTGGIDYIKAVGEYISFIDLSQNALTHQWEIDEENKYLKTGFNAKDSLPLFINSSLGTITKDKAAHVLFLKSGINEVTITNTFKDSVNFFGKDIIPSVKKGDVYEITRTWKVDVYANLEPEFKISNQAGTELYNSISGLMPTDGIIEIEAGEYLTYQDISTVGRANENLWRVTASNEKTAQSKETVNFTFFKIGEFSAGSLNLKRTGDLPAGSETREIPITVKVIQSSQPFTIASTGVTRAASNKLSFNVSGELKNFTGEEANFNVSVVNPNGFNGNIAVTNAAISSTNTTTIELTLAGDIYNTDEVKVSYTPGNIQSVDNRTLESFTDEVVEFTGGNILNYDHFSFESMGNEWFLQNAAQWSFSSSFANSGSSSLSFSVANKASMGANAKVQSTGNTDFKVAAGDYTYSLYIYIDASSDLSKLVTNFSGPWNPQSWDLTGVEKGKWVKLSKVITLADYDNTSAGKLIFQVNKSDIVTEGATIYVDDISLVPVEVRP